MGRLPSRVPRYSVLANPVLVLHLRTEIEEDVEVCADGSRPEQEKRRGKPRYHRWTLYGEGRRGVISLVNHVTFLHDLYVTISHKAFLGAIGAIRR